MDNLSFKAALNIVNNLDGYPEYQGVAGLTKLLEATTASVPGATSNSVSLLWSNMVGDVHASKLMQAIVDASGGRVNSVFDSGQGQLLRSGAFVDAFSNAAEREGYSQSDTEVLMSGGTLSNGDRLFGGLWGDASASYSGSANRLVTISPNADMESVLVQREIPSAIANGVSINGIPAEDLKDLSVEEAGKVVSAESLGLLDSVRFAFDGSGNIVGVDTGEMLPVGSISSLQSAPSGSAVYTGGEILAGSLKLPEAESGLNTDPLASPSDNGSLTGQNLTNMQEGALGLNDIIKAEGISYESLAGMGLGAAVIGASYYGALSTAQQQAESGDSAAAQKTMLDWTNNTEYSLGGAALAAEYAAPLLAGGPPGWAAYGALILGGGVAGSLVPGAMRDLLGALTGESGTADASQVTNSDGSIWSENTYSSGLQVGHLTYTPPGTPEEYQDTLTIPDDNGDGGYTKVSASASGAGVDTQTDIYAPVDGQTQLQSQATSSIDDKGNLQESVTNGSGALIESITDTQKNGGGDTEVKINFDGSGQVENTQNIDTQTNGSVTDDVSGTNADVDLNNASISLSSGSSATIAGSEDTVEVNANDAIALASGSDNDVLNLAGAGTVTIADGNVGETISASGSTFSLGQGVSATINGSADNFGASNDILTLLGSGYSLSGAGDLISASNATFSISNYNALSDVLIGDNNSISANSSVLTLDGSDESLFGGSNTLEFSGSNESVSGNFDTIHLDDGGSATLHTYGSLITLGDGVALISDGDGSNTITATSDDKLTIGNDSYYTDTLVVSNNQNIALDGGVYLNLVGTGNALTGAGGDTISGSGDVFTFLGSGDSVTGSGDMISASNGSLFISGGTSDAADVVIGDNNSISANSSVLTLDGSDESLVGGSNTLEFSGSNESVSGNFDTIHLDDGGSATLYTYGSSITLGDGVALISDGDGSNTITATSDDKLTIGNDSYYTDTLIVSNNQEIALDGGVYLNLVGTGNALTGAGGDTISGSGDVFTFLGSGDSVTGSGDTISASNDSLFISGGASGAADVVIGDNNSISAYSSVLTLQGSGETVTGSSDTLELSGIGESVSGNFETITLDDAASAFLHTYGASISLGADAALTSDGDGSNTIYATSDDKITIGYDSYYTDTLNVSDNQNIALDSGVYVNIVGAGNTITGAGGDAVYGSNDTFTFLGSGDLISGGGDTINASNDSLSITTGGGGASDVVVGDNNAISADNSSLVLEGSGESLSGNYDSVSIGEGETASLTTYGATVTLGSGSSLVSSGSGFNSIYAASDSTVLLNAVANSSYYFNDTLYANDNQDITLGTGASINVVGSGNTLTADGGDVVTANNDTLNILGSNDSITGGGDAISASGDSLSISNNGGASDVITGDNNTLSADHSALTLEGSGESVTGTFDTLSLAGEGETVSGNYNSVTFGPNTTASMTSYGDTIALGAGSSLSSVGDGFNTIYATSDDMLSIGATVNSDYYFTNKLYVNDNQSISLASGSSLNVIGSDNTVTANGGDNIIASNDTLDLVSGGDAITGAGDAISASGESLSIVNTGGGASDVITGDGNTVSADNSAVTLLGSNETLSASHAAVSMTGTNENVAGYYDSFSFGDDSSVNLNGYGHGITLGNDVTLISDGWGANSIYASTGDLIHIGATGNSDYSTDTINATGNQVFLDTGAAVNVVGDGNDITASGSDSISASDNNISVLGDGSAITGSGDTISATGQSLTISNRYSNAADVVTGNNNAISASNSNITLDGSANVLSGSNNTLTVTFGKTLSISGSGNVVQGSSDQITLQGDNNSMVVQGNKDNFSATGINDRIIDDRVDGTSVIYNWSGSGVETDTVYSGADGSGDVIGGYGYTGSGPGEDLPGSYGGGDEGGGYGFAGTQSLVSSRVGSSIGSIAQYDLSHGNFSAAQSAEAAQHQAASIAALTPTAGSGSAVLEGAKWDQQVITWSLAGNSGAQAAPFSGYMGSAEESVVQAAFGAWADAMPGVTFEEVADSPQSNIRIGFGDFDTANTGVIGYTSYQAKAGQLESNTIIRVEDTAQDALTTGADGQQIYAGTEATLSQVLQHEIGHALGFADNADQNSVMNYQLTASNRTLDQTDLAGIGSLYGAGSNTSPVGGSGVSQLIQAMSTFGADGGVADTTLLPPSLADQKVTLSASSHAA